MFDSLIGDLLAADGMHWSRSKLAYVPWCLWPLTTVAWISTSSVTRHDSCQHDYMVDRRLVVSFCSQPHYCNWPCYLAARF